MSLPIDIWHQVKKGENTLEKLNKKNQYSPYVYGSDFICSPCGKRR